jgi:hypothetical protein
VTFKKGAYDHPENHETYNLDTENGREIVEIHLKTLLVTCKSQWNSALGKHQEVNILCIWNCLYQKFTDLTQFLSKGRFGVESRSDRSSSFRAANMCSAKEERLANGKT